jgi:serine protease
MFVGDVIVTGDAGFHYVLLLDADTYIARYQDEVSATNGSYAYNFDAVAEGNYIVFAGTDSDNDLYIGDSGESTGAYISLDQPVIINVDENLVGIDFNTSFNLDLPTDLSIGSGNSKSGVRRMDAR